MGYWGTGLYDNDCTLDIRNAFDKLLQEGIDPRQAKLLLEDDYSDMFADSEEGALAKVALYDQLLTAGALKDEERDEVLSYIRSGGDLSLWMDATSALSARKAEWKRLETRFSTPVKTTQKKSPRPKQINWEVGEVYAIPLSQGYEDIFIGKHEYILLYIFSEGIVFKGYRLPMVWAKLTRNGILPQSAKEFNALEYVQIESTAFEKRYGPFKNEDDLPDFFRQTYQPDAWGYLPEYSFQMVEARGSHPPKSMICLGHFDSVQPPSNNYVRYRSGLGTAWKYLEEYVVLRYRLHNLRQAPFYQR